MTEKTALNVLMEALPYLRHSVKFYRFQRPGREFWPNREEVEGTIRDAEIVLQDGGKRPKIVTLCGSTRFGEAFDRANLEETLAGNIVLTVGCVASSDLQSGSAPTSRRR